MAEVTEPVVESCENCGHGVLWREGWVRCALGLSYQFVPARRVKCDFTPSRWTLDQLLQDANHILDTLHSLAARRMHLERIEKEQGKAVADKLKVAMAKAWAARAEARRLEGAQA